MRSSTVRRARWAFGAGALLVALGLVLFLHLRRAPESTPVKGQRFVEGGVALELTLEAVDSQRRGAPLREGDDVLFRVAVSDAATGAPYRGAYPAVWVEGRRPDEKGDTQGCRDKVKRFLEGGLLTSGGVLDLNIYHVLVLGQDGTVSVVDPRFGFGGSRLLTRIFLKSRGADWAMTAAQDKLFVSMPDSGRVAVIDPNSYRVVAELEAGARPEKLLLQPDEGYLWVASGKEVPAESASVTAISVADLKTVASIPVGQGQHAMAASDDSRLLFVTNREAGTVSVIDVRTGKKVKDLPVGRAPEDVAFSPLAKAAYVTVGGDGKVAVIDGRRQEVSAEIAATPGITRLGFERQGRFGFLLNPEQDLVAVLDSSVNRVIQSGKVEKGPDQVSFTDNLAYLRHRGSEVVYMIPLADIGTPGKQINIVDFPGGRLPPGPAALASSLVRAPGATAVLVANPADDAIYYYKEGMAAPMGHFKAYGGKPEGLLVLDRTLRERAPGVYETIARLPGAGLHDVAVLVTNPRAVHCFPAEFERDPKRAPERSYKLEFGPGEGLAQAGKPINLVVRLSDGEAGTPLTNLTDVELQIHAPGIGHWRQLATHRGEGVYVAEFALPSPGSYYVRAQSPSIGMEFNSAQHLILHVQPPGDVTR
jgi:YVTN family beta-propeller protein